MNYHPQALKLLHEFKKSSSLEIPNSLLPFYLETKTELNLDELYDILFSYKNVKNKELAMSYLKKAINESMKWQLFIFQKRVIKTNIIRDIFSDLEIKNDLDLIKRYYEEHKKNNDLKRVNLSDNQTKIDERLINNKNISNINSDIYNNNLISFVNNDSFNIKSNSEEKNGRKPQNEIEKKDKLNELKSKKHLIFKNIEIKIKRKNKNTVWILTRKFDCYSEKINSEFLKLWKRKIYQIRNKRPSKNFNDFKSYTQNKTKQETKNTTIISNEKYLLSDKNNPAQSGIKIDHIKSNDKIREKGTIKSSQEKIKCTINSFSQKSMADKNINDKITKNSENDYKNTTAGLLQFCKRTQRIPKFEPLGLFYPITFDKRAIVYDKTKTYDINFTLRKRNDIVKPVRRTFVKFHDQIRPPFYGIITKYNTKNTLETLGVVDDYDYDSDLEWEYEDAESLSSTEEDESEDDDYEVEQEDSDEEPTVREYRIPIPFKPNLVFEIINPYLDFSLPLEKRDIITEDERKIILNDYSNFQGNFKDFVKDFSDKFHLQPLAVSKVIEDINSKYFETKHI
ncbi:hypothetical protein DMUE_4344 [Dictyocoela muelleri]|nr:hypothetical protein DMUE_4344 [Dictyocoela muelleri]